MPARFAVRERMHLNRSASKSYSQALSTLLYWEDPDSWREARESLSRILCRHRDRTGELYTMAASIADLIRSMDAAMGNLCVRTCPSCSDPCCIRADVRYDLRDLIFLHCSGAGLPLGQTVFAPGAGACDMLSVDGCVLPRVMRPFMCTWYLCPPQMDIVRADPALSILPARLKEAKRLRKALEARFLAITSQ